MNKLKKLASFLFAVIMMFSVYATPVSAQTSATANVMTHGSDIYAEGYTESITIDGIEYTLEYSYDTHGNRVATQTNNANSDVDVYTYDIANSTISLNDETVATVESVVVNMPNSTMSASSSRGWVYIGSYSVKITFGMSTTALAIATVIALATANLTGVIVYIAIGATALLGFITLANGGTVSGDYYEYDPWSILPQIKEVWKFQINNETYGPYTNYIDCG